MATATKKQVTQQAVKRTVAAGSGTTNKTAGNGSSVSKSSGMNTGANKLAPAKAASKESEASAAKQKAADLAKSKSSTPAPAAPAPTAAAPVSAAPVPPGLTPDQTRAWEAYATSYARKMQSLQDSLTTATANTNQSLTAAQKTHDLNSNMENQSDAARGMFQSSIRDGDLNDIDSTLTMRQNLLNTNLHNLTLKVGTDSNNLTTDYNSTQNYYNTLAYANAAAQPPDTSTTTTPAPTASAAAPVAPAAPSAADAAMAATKNAAAEANAAAAKQKAAAKAPSGSFLAPSMQKWLKPTSGSVSASKGMAG